MRVLVAMEPGCTHEGDPRAMKDLILAASAAHCDAVKWQWVSSAERLANRRRAYEYQRYYDWIDFPDGWLAGLARRADDLGMEFWCTAYLPEDVETVAKYASRIKVSSFESRDDELLGAALATGKEVLVSTGLLDETALAELLALRVEWPRLRVLHCVSAYPAPADQLNLAAIRAYGMDGFSDHSASVWTGALAVMAGARVIEVHGKTETCRRDNPDYPHALWLAGLAEYVYGVRRAEVALGDGVKRPQPSEAPLARFRVRGGHTRLCACAACAANREDHRNFDREEGRG